MGPQIVLFLALLSLVPACAPQCRVQFCDASRTFPLGVSDRSLKPLCLHGTPLRNIQSGHARVVLGPRQVLLSNYSPQGLRQRFSPSFFKLYYKANGIGVGHETVQANQRDFLHARCIVLPIRGLRGVPNTASCVSYIVGTALSTPTATATPNSSPAPSSSSTPRSPTEATFSELTFATGEANRTTVVRTRDDRFGDSHYRLQYDIRVTPSGVVSLDDATPLISSVSCFTDGSINVVIKDSARAQLSGLADMYPRGAIIVVNRELYGPCQLQELTRAQQQTQENNDGDPTSAKNRALVDDGYLRIESVQGTPGNATIRGEPTAFPALFERARIILTNLAPLPPPRPSKGTTSVRQATTAADGSTTFGGAKTLELGLGLVQFDLKAQVENRGGFRVLDATIDSSGVNVEVSSVVDYTFTLEMLAKIRATLSPRSFKKSVDFISVPINGVKVGVSLEVSRRANSTNSVGIPLKFGTFFEIPIVLIAEIELSKDITTPGTAIFNSGRKEIKYFVSGPYRNLQYGSTPITSEKFSVSFDPPRLTGGILSSTDSSNKLSVSLFGGVRPKLAFYASFLEARISVDVGVELGVSGAIPGGAPFGPNSGIGASCDVCHLVDAEVNGVVQNFGFFLTNNLKFNGWLAKLLSKFIPQTLFSLTLPGNPTLKNNLLNTCFIPLPGASTGTEVCGDTCCDPSKPEVCSRAGGLTGSAVCTSSPTPVPTPSTPSPSPSPQPSPDGSTASTYTDPHIVTFDGLRYDCMATGEFILFKTGTVQVQGRFFGPSARGSVMTGIVAAEGSDKIQVTVQKNSTRPATIVAGACPVNMFLNGNMQNVGTTSGAAGGIRLTFPRNDSVQISLPSGVLFSFRVRPSSFFGCYFEQNNAFAPTALTANQATVGLLGSPNGNPDDDWMTRNGTVLSPPSTLSGRLYEKAYNYCTKNWCITDSTDSLFTYANGMSHSDFNKCNLPYTRVDFSRVSAALRDLCGTNAECLTDGVVSGDIGEARNTLRVQSEVDVARLGPSAISVSPQAISTNTSTNIRVEVDLSKLGSGGIRTDVDSYNLYKIDSNTRAIIGSVLVVLTSSGSGAPGKKVFSNTFAVRSAITGETFSFVGHPVIKGAENRNAGLSVSSLEAVRSFSPVSGIGVAPSNATFTTVPSISNDTVLKAEYTWPLNEPDLDTATQFFAETVGFGCSSSATYMTFTGDDTSSGGKETVRIQLGKSRADGKWAKDVTILFGAGWYNGRGKGPATLRVVLENTAGSAISEVLQVALNPTNSGPSCAGPPISATLKIDVGAKTTLTLSV